MRAIRFHYRPVRYLLTRGLAGRLPSVAWGPLGCVAFDEVEPTPLPGPEWVRVEPVISGICGSDLSAVTAHDSFTLEPFAAFPFTLGHENVGRIAEVGASVGSWRVGDRVIVHPMISCVQRGISPVCPACARGETGLCRSQEGPLGKGRMIGYSPFTGGGWSASFVAHHSQLHAQGDLSDEEAVLTDPFATTVRAVLLNPPGADDVVLVIGGGTIGALVVRALRLTGWTGPIAVSARYPFQRELAERAGASPILGGRKEVYAWAATLPGARALTPTLGPGFVEGGPSLVYDTVGKEGSMSDALALTREGGRVVLLGSAARLSADWTRVWYRQLSVAGAFAYGPVPFEGRQVEVYHAALALMRRGDLAALRMLTHVFALREYRAALAAAIDKRGHGSIKVAFRPGD